MIETVIVTVEYDNQSADFELPSSVKIKDWILPLKSALRNSFYGIRLENKTIELYYKNKPLADEDTLFDCGIYDGSILVLALK